MLKKIVFILAALALAFPHAGFADQACKQKCFDAYLSDALSCDPMEPGCKVIAQEEKDKCVKACGK